MVPAYRVAEVTRLATDGTKNACSMLYSARACLAMGYERIQTYILDHEPGTSLRASGWRLDGTSPGGDWNAGGEGTHKGRRTDQPLGAKQRWVKELSSESIVRRRDAHLGPKGRPTP